MTQPQFDPSGFYEFDLPTGKVKGRSGARVVVLSDDVVGPLVAAASAQGDLTPVRTLGSLLGREVLASLGGPPMGLPSDVVLGHAASVFAMHGFGALSFERWGDALVLQVKDAPVLDAAWLGLAAVLGGMFSVATGLDVACVPVEPGRFLMCAPAIAGDVWNAAQNGASLGVIVGSLKPGGGLA